MLVGSDLSRWRRWREAHWSINIVSHRSQPRFPLLLCNYFGSLLGTMTTPRTYLHDLNPNPWYHLHLCYYLIMGLFFRLVPTANMWLALPRCVNGSRPVRLSTSKAIFPFLASDAVLSLCLHIAYTPISFLESPPGRSYRAILCPRWFAQLCICFSQQTEISPSDLTEQASYRGPHS